MYIALYSALLYSALLFTGNGEFADKTEDTGGVPGDEKIRWFQNINLETHHGTERGGGAVGRRGDADVVDVRQFHRTCSGRVVW